jgi:hypothetical protein
MYFFEHFEILLIVITPIQPINSQSRTSTNPVDVPSFSSRSRANSTGTPPSYDPSPKTKTSFISSLDAVQSPIRVPKVEVYK